MGDVMDIQEHILEEGLNQVLAVAKDRAHTLGLLKKALIEGDDERVRHYAEQLCGIKKEGCRVPEGVDSGTER